MSNQIFAICLDRPNEEVVKRIELQGYVRSHQHNDVLHFVLVKDDVLTRGRGCWPRGFAPLRATTTQSPLVLGSYSS